MRTTFLRSGDTNSVRWAVVDRNSRDASPLKESDILSNVESISDTCSDVGVSTIARVHADVASKSHYYISSLHQGNDKTFNEEYNSAHEEYFEKLKNAEEVELKVKLENDN